MFKKVLEAKSQQRLSGADRKKLKRAIRGRFPNASDADIDSLLPPKSVYALWKVPNLLPAFALKGGEVSRFILGGADLMFPGIRIPEEGLAPFSDGEPWAVVVPGNLAPIAVGTTMMSSTEALKAGLRGKALRISHYYRDKLWESSENCYVPNSGFFEDVVVADSALLSSLQASDSREDDSSVGQGDVDNENMTDANYFDEIPPVLESDLIKDSVVPTEASEQITTAMTDLQIENDPGLESNVDRLAFAVCGGDFSEER